jgi:hypothetical protein
MIVDAQAAFDCGVNKGIEDSLQELAKLMEVR